MKYWVIIAIIVLGLMITVIGALFKIQHWTGASAILITGMGLKALGLLLLVIKIIKERNSNSLLKK